MLWGIINYSALLLILKSYILDIFGLIHVMDCHAGKHLFSIIYLLVLYSQPKVIVDFAIFQLVLFCPY